MSKEIDNNEKIEFWGNNPNVLFSTFELFPLNKMSFEQQLNALTRMIICISIVLFFYFQSYHIVITFIATLFLIYFIYTQKMKKYEEEGFSEKQKQTQTQKQEPSKDIINTKDIIKEEIKFQAPTSKNPFSNILLSDKSNKLPAPPISNIKVNDDILFQAKKMVQENNSKQPNIVDKLFKDLDEELSFEQSLRPFYSTSNTTIPNDQGAFAEFCYGNMISCKEGNLFACARNLSNHYNI